MVRVVSGSSRRGASGAKFAHLAHERPAVRLLDVAVKVEQVLQALGERRPQVRQISKVDRLVEQALEGGRREGDVERRRVVDLRAARRVWTTSATARQERRRALMEERTARPTTTPTSVYCSSVSKEAGLNQQRLLSSSWTHMPNRASKRWRQSSRNHSFLRPPASTPSSLVNSMRRARLRWSIELEICESESSSRRSRRTRIVMNGWTVRRPSMPMYDEPA